MSDDCPQVSTAQVISYLRSLERRGIRSVYLRTPAQADPADVVSTTTKENTVTRGTVVQELAGIEADVSTCTECALHKGRTKTVFGHGSPQTKVMFIGEGPGRDENIQGKPFVGRSGQLLTKMLAAIDLDRDDVYITNIVKCRPPDNRDPQEDEVRCCEKYLERQIDTIKPKLICALGRVSAHWLLDSKESLASLRQSENEYRGTQVLVTYHPAALLRNPNLKKSAWEDLKRLRSIIDDA